MTYDVMTYDIIAYDNIKHGVMTYDVMTYYDVIIYDVILRRHIKPSKWFKCKNIKRSKGQRINYTTTSLTCPPSNMSSATPARVSCLFYSDPNLIQAETFELSLVCTFVKIYVDIIKVMMSHQTLVNVASIVNSEQVLAWYRV